jgi:hypothetical protein
VGHREHGEVELGIHQAARLVGGHVHAELLEQPEDGAGLDRPRRVVVARDEHDRRPGQRLAQPLQLTEGENDGGVGGAHRVKEIARDEDQIRTRGDDPVHGEPEGAGHVGFALVDAGRSLAVVLARPEVGVGKVSHFHTWNVSPAGDLSRAGRCRNGTAPNELGGRAGPG